MNDAIPPLPEGYLGISSEKAAEIGARAHPVVAETMKHMQEFMKVLDGVKSQFESETFTGTDEDQTVEATVDSRHWLVRLDIEDGLLRHGTEEVNDRINAAIRNAHGAATADSEAQQAKLFSTLTQITGALRAGMGLD